MARPSGHESPTARRGARGWPPASAALPDEAPAHALSAARAAAAVHRRRWGEARSRFGAFREGAWLEPPS